MHAVDPEARGLGDFCSDAFATVCFVGRCGCIGCESGSSSIGCLGQLQILGGLNGEFCPPAIPKASDDFVLVQGQGRGMAGVMTRVARP